MRVVRRADVHCVHIRAVDQVVVIRKPALRGDAVFLADRIQLFPVNIADGHKLQIRALAYAGLMHAGPDAAYADGTNSNDLIFHIQFLLLTRPYFG